MVGGRETERNSLKNVNTTHRPVVICVWCFILFDFHNAPCLPRVALYVHLGKNSTMKTRCGATCRNSEAVLEKGEKHPLSIPLQRTQSRV